MIKRAGLLAIAIAVAMVAVATAEETEPASKAYQVGAGDTIAVEAFQHTEVSGSFLIEESGSVTYPLLGNVNVSGLTSVQIARLLEQLLEKDFYVDVQIQVEVKDYRSKPVTILGEIQKPGTFYLHGPTTLTQMISEAGGFRSSAGATLELRRMEIEEGVSVQKVYTFSTEKLNVGEVGGTFELVEGDVLSVHARQMYFITGEIAGPGKYEITIGMTLMQAISEAGGLGKFASQAVELHREVDGEKKIMDFDYSRIRKGKDEDPPVKSGDVIYIKRRFF